MGYFLINQLIFFVLIRFFVFGDIVREKNIYVKLALNMEGNYRQSVNIFTVTRLKGYENLQVILHFASGIPLRDFFVNMPRNPAALSLIVCDMLNVCTPLCIAMNDNASPLLRRRHSHQSHAIKTGNVPFRREKDWRHRTWLAIMNPVFRISEAFSMHRE